MAEIFGDTRTIDAPYTPTKGPIASSTEVPEYSPGAAPVYQPKEESQITVTEAPDATASSSDAVEAVSYKNGPVNTLPIFGNHPVLPIGNVVHDVKNHLFCHEYYNGNVDVLLREFSQMKKDLAFTRDLLGSTQRELKKERAEKEALKLENEVLHREIIALREELAWTRDELQRARDDLAASERRVAELIRQLADVVRKLEETRIALREMTKKRDELQREVINIRRELDFYKSRCTELQTALEIANAGENAANDRNTRLSKMLYEIEASKAAIERVKDEYECTIRNLKLDLDDDSNRVIIDKLRRDLSILKFTKDVLEKELQRVKGELADSNVEIIGLRSKITQLGKDIEGVKKNRGQWVDLVYEYERRVKKIPSGKYHKAQSDCHKHFSHGLRKPGFVYKSIAEYEDIQYGILALEAAPAEYMESAKEVEAEAEPVVETQEVVPTEEAKEIVAPATHQEEPVVNADETVDSNTDA